MSILRLEQVSKNYQTNGTTVSALRDITLAVKPGEFVALLGPSGCGKSTLLNLAGAMDFPTSGQVILRGIATSALDDSALTRLRRETIGFVFQSFQLLPTLTVAENVELPLLLAGAKGARAAALRVLEQVEMDGFASRMPYQLSGGQMQRVAIARALIHTPAILLADEPTGNLDSATGDLILALLRRIANTGQSTVMLATHSAEAATLADTVVRMRDGRIQEIRENARKP
ncbi:MAG TPA: ABC transporter ATP-binding protein [Bryobacteraceae bacterium]|nr:ABC transporter ATP-binding protein [Bryobacteraceae bacterium]